MKEIEGKTIKASSVKFGEDEIVTKVKGEQSESKVSLTNLGLIVSANTIEVDSYQRDH